MENITKLDAFELHKDKKLQTDNVRRCSVKNCSNTNKNSEIYMSKKFNRLLCQKHITQLKRYGRILPRTKFDKNEIIIKDNYAELLLYNIKNIVIAKAKIDIEDVARCELYKWRLDGDYVATQINKKKVYLHRFIMNCNDPNVIVNHIAYSTESGKKNLPLDNRKKSLEIIPENLNGQNMSLSKTNSSGFTGVSYRKDKGMWEAYLNIDGRRIFLGLFPNINEAIILRLKAEKKYNIKTQSHLFDKFNITSNSDLSCITDDKVPEYFRDKISVKFANDRAKLKKVKADLTLEQFIQIKEYFKDSDNILRCAYCKTKLSSDNEVLDHVNSIVNGGESTKSNVVPCCRECNQDKGSKDFYQWYTNKCFYSDSRYNEIIELISNTNKYVYDNAVFIDIILDSPKMKYFKAEDPTGKIFISNNQTRFAKEHNMSQTGIYKCLRPSSKNKTCKGFSFEYLSHEEIVNYLESEGKIVKSLGEYMK